MKDSLKKEFSWVGGFLRFVAIVGGVLAFAYLLFFLKLGQFTFAQHVKRIWQTPEVAELRSGVATKLTRTGHEALRTVRNKLDDTRAAAEPPQREVRIPRIE
jgi:hypothetical protein